MLYRIVGARFPYLDKFPQSKGLPVLIITEKIGPYSLVVVAYITTNIDVCEITDVTIEQGQKEFDRTGLTRTSIIQLHKLFTLSINEIYDDIGSLNHAKSKEVQQKLRMLFHID